MTIELTPEIEQLLKEESSATGLSPAEITLRVLTTYAQSRPSLQTITADSITLNPNISADLLEQRRAAADRIIARRNASSAAFGPPAGMDWREWIHEDHKY